MWRDSHSPINEKWVLRNWYFVQMLDSLINNSGFITYYSTACFNYNKFVCSRLCSPDLTGPAQDLSYVGMWARKRKHFKAFLSGVKLHQRVCCEIAQPNHVLIIHINRIGHWVGTRQTPLLPFLCSWLVHSHLSCVPLTHPNPSLRVRPNTPCSLIWSQRL